ncbi:MAG: hypothetical protein NVS1B4_04120 [Gemmatimonadaceae bacterium]
MASTFEAFGSDAVTPRAVTRYLAARFGSSPVLGADSPPLEAISRHPQRARITAARLIEGTTVSPRRIPAESGTRFTAFLHGVQRSRVVACGGTGVPIVFATVAAVIRERRERRMTTWRQTISQVLCIPRRLDPGAWDTRAPLTCVDTLADESSGEVLWHPTDLIDRAIATVQTQRQAAEQMLAKAWIEDARGMLLIDGGIGDRERVAGSASVVGVIKSHRTLYGDGDVAGMLRSLAAGERSPVFRVAAERRAPVASWYLRLRNPRGPDPFFGLVRVEVSDGWTDDALTRRVDEISGWILSERVPLSLPDARWDRTVYGIRDCEQYLAAVI